MIGSYVITAVWIAAQVLFALWFLVKTRVDPVGFKCSPNAEIKEVAQNIKTIAQCFFARLLLFMSISLSK